MSQPSKRHQKLLKRVVKANPESFPGNNPLKTFKPRTTPCPPESARLAPISKKATPSNDPYIAEAHRLMDQLRKLDEESFDSGAWSEERVIEEAICTGTLSALPSSSTARRLPKPAPTIICLPDSPKSANSPPSAKTPLYEQLALALSEDGGAAASPANLLPRQAEILPPMPVSIYGPEGVEGLSEPGKWIDEEPPIYGTSRSPLEMS